jgi:branched-chain amino acid aminotransferase
MITLTNKIAVKQTANPRVTNFDFKNIQFGKQFSDHMFIAQYKDGKWGNLEIAPFGDFQMSPAAGALHYGQAIFEGMKAYKGEDGKVILFRPELNIERMNISAERLCMPTIPSDIFMDGLKQLLDIDREWVPALEGNSLYIRPFMFASEPVLGVRPSSTYHFMIITSPVGSYYAEPVKLKVEKRFTRAANGGVGFAKAAGNYAAALYPAMLAAKEGYHQLLWTDANEHRYFEEAGTMNIMFQIDNKLITPSLAPKTILGGITRRSVLELATEWGIKVEERKVSVAEVLDALKSNRLQDAFGVGTAANIAQVALIGFDEEDYELPPVGERELSNKLKRALDAIKKGKVEDQNNWTLKV